MTQNEQYLNEAQARAKEFETEREPARLREAYMALQNVVIIREHDPKARALLRRKSLEMWLGLVEILDRFLDPNFDPKDVPEMTVQPPPGRDGVALPPGADPAKIDDPRARADYDKAIAANRANAERYRLQSDLRRVNERVTQLADAFIRSSYTSTKRDQEELRATIDKTIKNPTRKAELQRLLSPEKP